MSRHFTTHGNITVFTKNEPFWLNPNLSRTELYLLNRWRKGAALILDIMFNSGMFLSEYPITYVFNMKHIILNTTENQYKTSYSNSNKFTLKMKKGFKIFYKFHINTWKNHLMYAK